MGHKQAVAIYIYIHTAMLNYQRPILKHDVCIGTMK